MDEMMKQILEALKAIQAKLDEMSKEDTSEDTPTTPPADTPPPADEAKALKESVAKMAGDVAKLTEIVTHLVQKQ